MAAPLFVYSRLFITFAHSFLNALIFIMLPPLVKYPIGIQSFSKLREDGYLYIDKTSYLHRLVKNGICYFISRPRRFGKSLLLTTLEAYFRGEKNLFEGLAIYDLEKEWKVYPVVRIDFNAAGGVSHEDLRSFLLSRIKRYAEDFGVEIDPALTEPGQRFGDLIQQLHKKTGERVVVLIDEYDKGLVETLHDEKALGLNETLLRGFFSQLKAQDEHLRFAMLTGVARFKYLTIFSGLNNLNDISLDPEYAAICGITLEELEHNLRQEVEAMGQRLKLDYQATLDVLIQRYDGYQFTEEGIRVFNPFSLLCALSKKRLANFWLMSGTSRVFMRYIQGSDFQLADLLDTWATEGELSARYSRQNPIPLLYQTGYLTIKDSRGALYRLGLPNGEVRSSLVEELIPTYLKERESKGLLQVEDLKQMVVDGEPERWLPLLRSMLASVPYEELEYKTVEKSFHLMVYMVFLMLGIETRAEVSVAGGRIDMVAQTPRFVYVMEFKVDSTAQEALDQINSRDYALPYEASGRRVFKIGIPFSSATRTMGEYLIEN